MQLHTLSSQALSLNIDQNGQVYSSDFTDQSTDSFFKINSVEDYDTNEAGIPTKKVAVDFSCKLMNADKTLSKTLSNVKGTVAVGYPK